MNKFYKNILGVGVAIAAVVALIGNFSPPLLAQGRIAWQNRTNVTVYSTGNTTESCVIASATYGSQDRIAAVFCNTNRTALTPSIAAHASSPAIAIRIGSSVFFTNQLNVADIVVNAGETVTVSFGEGLNGPISARCLNTNVDLNLLYWEIGN